MFIIIFFSFSSRTTLQYTPHRKQFICNTPI